MNIKAIINSIVKFIKNLFSKMPVDVKKAIEIGVLITENLKKFVDSPGADALTLLIPGEIDDKLKTWLRQALPQILIKLKLAIADDERVVALAAKELNKMDADVKRAYLHSISVLCAQAASEKKLTWSDGVYLLEWYYKNKYKLITS
ncbi:hypothetical protein LJ707_12745 [Mucilaginibacter sp. UR6-1]|uniref:hypothetical protein n=1 Tax=Mucilaginibacter sp. UR6-1 TaxID=1435643 RepID=UPI001E53E856|nr:hypothetical protein [Mucilaginibacter sp. UR6-1]MCC8409800.1 hypothetical protein [Mucilaginibacter sp. UR6-1]